MNPKRILVIGATGAMGQYLVPELSEIKTRRLELQPNRTLAENIDELPQGCDWGGKRNKNDQRARLCRIAA